MLNVYTVAFFGHRHLEDPFEVEQLLQQKIRALMEEHEYVDFLVGRNGEFDQRVSSAVVGLRKHYRDDNSSLVLVLPYPTAEYLHNQEAFHDYYTEVEICHAASTAHPKSAIQIRNRQMVDSADLVICYIQQKHGGAWQTVEYAQKQRKPVINLFDLE